MSSDILPPPPPPITRSPLHRGHSRAPSTSETPSTLTPQIMPSVPSSTAPLTPLLVYSHGQTQVDTFTPNSETIQRALYTWSQVADYSTVFCERLPMHNGAILEPLCPLETRSQCPGHPWIDYSYHCKVKEWTQDKRSYLIQQRQQQEQQQQQQLRAANTSSSAASSAPLPMPPPPLTYVHTHPDRAPMQSPLFVPIAQQNISNANEPQQLTLNLIGQQAAPPTINEHPDQHAQPNSDTAHSSSASPSVIAAQQQTHDNRNIKREEHFTQRHSNVRANNNDDDDYGDHHMTE